MNSIEEKFAQLRPVLGNKIFPLWLGYCAGNQNEKKEIEAIVDVFRYHLLNESFSPNNILFEPPLTNKTIGKYIIGHVCYGQEKIYPFGLKQKGRIEASMLFL